MRNRPNKAVKKLEVLKRHVGGDVKESLRGVPYLLIDKKISVSWFGRGQHFRVFYPFMSSFQSKADCKDYEAVKQYVGTLRVPS